MTPSESILKELIHAVTLGDPTPTNFRLAWETVRDRTNLGNQPALSVLVVDPNYNPTHLRSIDAYFRETANEQGFVGMVMSTPVLMDPNKPDGYMALHYGMLTPALWDQMNTVTEGAYFGVPRPPEHSL